MQDVMAFLTSHQGLVTGVVVAVLDLVFALSPKAAGNGLLHQVYVWIKPPAPPKV
jgi:hypothetical protein